jgi:hypothetical protein
MRTGAAGAEVAAELAASLGSPELGFCVGGVVAIGSGERQRWRVLRLNAFVGLGIPKGRS